MGITNSGQLNELFLAGGVGFLLGAFYDVFRVIRLMMKPSAKWVFVQDLLFFSISAMVTFLFALAVNGGELRLYLIVGLTVGFTAYLVTVGRLVVRFARQIIQWVIFLWHWFWFAVCYPFRLFLKLIKKLFSRPAQAIKRQLLKRKKKPEGKIKKIFVFLKKPLHLPGTVLYNQNNKGN